MVTIRRQLTLKEALGTKVPNFVPATPIATFTTDELNVLLGGTTPVPEGIRFHFEKAADNTTVGLIAVSLGVRLVDSPAGGTTVANIEMTSATKKYLWHGTQQRQLTVEEYHTQFPGQATKGAVGRDGISNACVFFSGNDLREIRAQTGVVEIAFFRNTISRKFDPALVEENFDTLVAIGRNSAGATVGLQIQSELPCPPHCGDDYP